MHCTFFLTKFYIFLTVLLRITLVAEQLDAQFIYNVFI